MRHFIASYDFSVVVYLRYGKIKPLIYTTNKVIFYLLSCLHWLLYIQLFDSFVVSFIENCHIIDLIFTACSQKAVKCVQMIRLYKWFSAFFTYEAFCFRISSHGEVLRSIHYNRIMCLTRKRMYKQYPRNEVIFLNFWNSPWCTVYSQLPLIHMILTKRSHVGMLLQISIHMIRWCNKPFALLIFNIGDNNNKNT